MRKSILIIEKMKGNNNIHKALVVGLGYRTGLAVSNFLAAREIAVVASDSKSEADLSDVLSKLDPTVRVVAGAQDPALLDGGFDAVILSPGVPKTIPLVAEAGRRGIPVMAEVELAFRHMKGSVVGITGTDGKSTTTALTGHVFHELGIDTHVGGNIGIPLVSFVDKTNDESVVVAELSSFQLETIVDFRPDVAALLNVTPDHLDRYDGMEEYLEAKMRIAMNQDGGDYFIYNRDDVMSSRSSSRVKSRVLSFSIETGDADIFYRDGAVYLRDDGRKVLETGRMKVLGLHNVQNAMVAILAARAVLAKRGKEADFDAIAEAVYSFPGLEHRLERIGVFQGREFINDSKATTVNAVLTALRSFPGMGVLILGGRTKGDDYSRLKIGLEGKIRSIVLIGESKEYFAKILGGFRHVFAESLDDAVVKAMRESREGDVVLLSPACASFDMFKNYEERGMEFAKSFRRLESGALSWT
ncbi:MAG: UDP-N-acetylmuramoyl-L-alanine--D-glutamate ligase [Spirochaetes bacterium]|nr:UDP-N-acetylmuramoyl-L-alanine--D-glutamate ligase [Spirochaetota bacterium]